jgi:hypothetical protein
MIKILNVVKKLGERKENRITRPTRVTRGAFFLTTIAMVPPRFDRKDGLLFINLSPGKVNYFQKPG